MSPRTTTTTMTCVLLGLAVSACGPEVRTFDVTLRTVRSCRPAGLIPQLCEDPSEFAGRHRSAVFTVEMRGPTQFILYDDQGRALPGVVQGGAYFARGISTTVDTTGCAKTVERSIKFELVVDRLPTIPGVREHARTRMKGTAQDRANQSLQCGNEGQSKLEEAFEGDESTPSALEQGEAAVRSRVEVPG